MMLVDVTLVNSYHKPYADSTLNNMKKSELIEYVRMLEHNYNVAVSFNHQQAKNFEKMLEQKHGRWIEFTRPADRLFGLFQPYRKCSECGKDFIGGADHGTNYCPNCGAKMDDDYSSPSSSSNSSSPEM